MAVKLPKPISKMSIKALLDLDWDTIRQFDTKQSLSYEKRLRVVTEKRLKTIKKYKEYSGAAETYFGKVGIPEVSTSKSTRNEMQRKIATYKDFLESKTSSLTGLRKVRKEAEKRIFGTNKKGEPKYKFTNLEEERRFWKAYEEFMHQNSIYFNQSFRIQQFLGQETFWKTRDFTQSDFNSLLVKLNTEESGPNWWSDMEDYL